MKSYHEMTPQEFEAMVRRFIRRAQKECDHRAREALKSIPEVPHG